MTPIDSGIALDVFGLLRLTLLVTATGWAANGLIESGVHSRVLPSALGVAGVVIGAWMRAQGWEAGPMIDGVAVLPMFVGTLIASAFVKLAVIGVAGSRW